jgi:hypothetical protein
MNKNNIAWPADRFIHIAVALCLVTGPLATALAADQPVNAQPQETAQPNAAVDVETFHGAGILSPPGGMCIPSRRCAMVVKAGSSST